MCDGLNEVPLKERVKSCYPEPVNMTCLRNMVVAGKIKFR